MLSDESSKNQCTKNQKEVPWRQESLLTAWIPAALSILGQTQDYWCLEYWKSGFSERLPERPLTQVPACFLMALEMHLPTLHLADIMGQILIMGQLPALLHHFRGETRTRVGTLPHLGVLLACGNPLAKPGIVCSYTVPSHHPGRSYATDVHVKNHSYLHDCRYWRESRTLCMVLHCTQLVHVDAILNVHVTYSQLEVGSLLTITNWDSSEQPRGYSKILLELRSCGASLITKELVLIVSPPLWEQQNIWPSTCQLYC